MTENIKNLSPNIIQTLLRTLGMACSTYLANDLYYYLKVNQMIINDVGEDFVKNELQKEGRDWDSLKIRIEIISKKVIKAKAYYDMIEDKTFSKKEREERNKSEFLRIVSRISIVDNPILFIFGFLVRKTNLQRMIIPNDAFKILEHSGFRTLELSKKTKMPTSSDSNILTEENK
jgi:hypothetical protein